MAPGQRSTWEFLPAPLRLHHREAAEGLPQLFCNLVGKRSEIAPPHNVTATYYFQLFSANTVTVPNSGLCTQALPAAVGETFSDSDQTLPGKCRSSEAPLPPSPFPPGRHEDPSTYELLRPSRGLAPCSHPSATTG